MPKLLLINPVNPNRKGLSESRYTCYPPLGLGIIAALTPKNWQIRIIDENFERFQYEEADLVGITAFTASVNRAYQIAASCKKHNTHTVIGGIHASMLPDEAAQFVDTVVKGDAESTWPALIEDFENNAIKPLYEGTNKKLNHIPIPRNDLYHNNYTLDAVQTARGCPMNCEFCSVSPFNGTFYYQRPVEDVLNELEHTSKKMILFVDDNILGYGKQAEERAIQLFQGMIDRKIDKIWFTHASINIVENEEVVRLAAKSGCRALFIGIEAETKEALQEINKYENIKKVNDRYKRVFKILHKYKIVVIGAMLYGLDADTPQKLKQRTRFVIRSGIDAMQTLPVTPLPGTRFMERLKKENRLLYTNFPDDWEKHDATEVAIKPAQMSTEALSSIMNKTHKKLYSFQIIIFKALKTLYETKSLNAAKWAFWSNISYRNFLYPPKRYENR